MLVPNAEHYIGKTKEEIFNSCKGQIGNNPSFDDKLILNMISLWFLTDNNGKIDNIDEAKSLNNVFADPFERAGKEVSALDSNILFEGLVFGGKSLGYLLKTTAYAIAGAVGAVFQ